MCSEDVATTKRMLPWAMLNTLPGSCITKAQFRPCSTATPLASAGNTIAGICPGYQVKRWESSTVNALMDCLSPGVSVGPSSELSCPRSQWQPGLDPEATPHTWLPLHADQSPSPRAQNSHTCMHHHTVLLQVVLCQNSLSYCCWTSWLLGGTGAKRI